MPRKTTVLPDGTKPCSKCKAVKHTKMFYTTGRKSDGSPKLNSWCKDCVLEKMSLYHRKSWGAAQLSFTAHKRTKTIRDYLAYLRSKAVSRRGASISLDELEQIYAEQKGRCALTGVQMTRVLGNGKVNTNISIDRIDSTRGYESGNVQLVCARVNVCKGNMDQKDFVEMCHLIWEVHRGVQNSGVAKG